MEDFTTTEVQRVIQGLHAGAFSTQEVAAAYAAIQALRNRADRLERDLIRALRWHPTELVHDKRTGEWRHKVLRTWDEVARLINAQLGSRQAAHRRWNRIKSPTLRQLGGAAVPRDQREHDAAD